MTHTLSHLTLTRIQWESICSSGRLSPLTPSALITSCPHCSDITDYTILCFSTCLSFSTWDHELPRPLIPQWLTQSLAQRSYLPNVCRNSCFQVKKLGVHRILKLNQGSEPELDTRLWLVEPVYINFSFKDYVLGAKEANKETVLRSSSWQRSREERTSSVQLSLSDSLRQCHLDIIKSQFGWFLPPLWLSQRWLVLADKSLKDLVEGKMKIGTSHDQYQWLLLKCPICLLWKHLFLLFQSVLLHNHN